MTNNATPGAGVLLRHEDWSFEVICRAYLREGKLSRRMFGKLKQMVLLLTETCEDPTADLPQPDKNVISDLGCDGEWINTSWAMLGCFVLEECEPGCLDFEYGDSASSIPLECLGAIPHYDQLEIWLDLDKVFGKILPLSDFKYMWGQSGVDALNTYLKYEQDAEKSYPSLRNLKPSALRDGYQNPSKETQQEFEKSYQEFLENPPF